MTVFPIGLNGDQFPALRTLMLNRYTHTHTCTCIIILRYFPYSNSISVIEDKDLKLRSLQELYISRNSIVKLPFAFLAGLNSLKVLDASRNCIGLENLFICLFIIYLFVCLFVCLCLEFISGEAAEYTCSLQDLKIGHNKLVENEHEFQSFIKTALVYVASINRILIDPPPPPPLPPSLPPPSLPPLPPSLPSLPLSPSSLSIQSVDATSNDLLSVPPPYMWRSRGLKHLILGSNKISSVS